MNKLKILYVAIAVLLAFAGTATAANIANPGTVTSTLIIGSSDTITVESGTPLTIDAGGILIVEGELYLDGGIVNIYGTLVNNRSVRCNGPSGAINIFNNFINHGTVFMSDIPFFNHGTFKNLGSFQCYQKSDNYGTIINEGLFLIVSGSFTNHGSIFNNGTLDNMGSTFKNNGTIKNDYFFANGGTLINNDCIENNDRMYSDGRIYNNGKIVNYDSINSEHGYILNSQLIENMGLIIIEVNGLSNQGTVNNYPSGEIDQLSSVTGNPVNFVSGTPSQCIPEFPTITLPVVAIIGLALFFQRRKD